MVYRCFNSRSLDSGPKPYFGGVHQACYHIAYSGSYSDQQATTMLSTKAIDDATLLHATNYDLFGMVMKDREYDAVGYRYGFNGKEKDSEWGGNYDYGARMYDPRVGRWLSVGPMANKFSSWSPYYYSINNPILFVDESGMEPTKVGALGLSAYLNVISIFKYQSDILSSLHGFYGGYSNTNTSNSKSDQSRYLYSTRWWWIDLNHFFTAANTTDNALVSGDRVLARGGTVEREQAAAGDVSAYDYEDLVFSLLGVCFEQYLEDFDSDDLSEEEKNGYKELGSEIYILKSFLRKLGL